MEPSLEREGAGGRLKPSLGKEGWVVVKKKGKEGWVVVKKKGKEGWVVVKKKGKESWLVVKEGKESWTSQEVCPRVSIANRTKN